MRPGTKQWLEIAESDYEVGLHLFKRANHPQALYLICQAVEKVLKAAQIEFANERPQKTHEFEKIAIQTKLPFAQEQYRTLKELTKHYKRVRYPDFARIDYNTKAKVQPIINQAQTIYLWILNKFKNP